jgi:hypothetical protein
MVVSCDLVEREVRGQKKGTLMIETTKATESSNLDMSTSKWFKSLSSAFSSTTEHLALTDPMLRRYAAGSTSGSGALGIGI